jgi:outer membrane protein
VTQPLVQLLLSALFLGPVQAPAPLTSSDAVKIALQDSPRLRAARAVRDAARAQNERERPIARPAVNFEAVGQFQGPRVGLPRGDETVVPERYGRVELSVEQILYRAGLGAARTRFASQERSADWELRRAEQETALAALRAYYAMIGAEAQLGVATEAVTMAQKQLDLTRTLLEAGAVSERDLKASEADLAEARLGASRAGNGAALARANLNRTLGRDPSMPVTLPAAEPAPAVSQELRAAQQEALAARPEIRLLQENLAAARAGISLASTQDRPTLSARAIAAAQTPTAISDSKYFAAGFTVRWSPFDQGRTRADVREAKAHVAQLEALLEDAMLGIKVEVEKAWRDIVDARERVGVAGRQVDSATAALDISRVRFEAGSSTQMEVSGAMFGLIKALGNRAQAESDLQLAHAELLYATGRAASSAAPGPAKETRP